MNGIYNNKNLAHLGESIFEDGAVLLRDDDILLLTALLTRVLEGQVHLEKRLISNITKIRL